MMPYLINDRYLTDFTSVATSNADKMMKVAMQAVTIINMKPLMGIPLYELYQNHLINSTTLTELQSELFDKLKYYMALMVEREMLNNTLNINNKGVTQDEHSANMEVIKDKRQEALSKANFMKKDILDFLHKNKAMFTEYYPESITPEVVNGNDYSAGIIFSNDPKIIIN